MHTSQPGVSQQIRLLEEELGVSIFTREKNRVSGLTPHGKMIVERLNAALSDIDYVQAYANSLRADGKCELTVITSHTQAEVRKRINSAGAVIVANSPEEFTAFIRAEIVKWGKAAKASGARAE